MQSRPPEIAPMQYQASHPDRSASFLSVHGPRNVSNSFFAIFDLSYIWIQRLWFKASTMIVQNVPLVPRGVSGGTHESFLQAWPEYRLHSVINTLNPIVWYSRRQTQQKEPPSAYPDDPTALVLWVWDEKRPQDPTTMACFVVV